jgi:two-component system sensor histidine kinase UhpB
MTIAFTAESYSPVSRAVRRVAHGVLAFPLAGKILGANAIIVCAGFAYQALASVPSERATVFATTIAMIAASIVNVGLVRLALRPVRDLGVLARKVSLGNFNARSEPSPFADAELSTLGNTIDGLLDSLAFERERIRVLGAEVMYAEDNERAKVSRELHDSIAQTLAGVKFQISAAGAGASDEVRNHLAAVSAMIAGVTDEIRDVSYTLHPRVAQDLGLESALTALAGRVKVRSGVDVVVSVNVPGKPIPSTVVGTLYRVAEEALKNIEMHARAKNATVEVVAYDGNLRIVVSDDGQGFDSSRIDRLTGRTGLASVKDRVVLAGGSMKIDSKPNGGTRVMADLQTSGVVL